MIQMELLHLITDGYERTAQFAALDNKTIWCHFLQHDEYLNSGEESQKLRTGARVHGQLSIQWVTDCKKANDESQPGYRQPLVNSSHIEAVGRVIEVEDDYECICDFGPLGKAISVEFEVPVDVKEGDLIRIEGSLEWEPHEEE